MDEPTYKIRRFYFNENHPDHHRIVKTGLTLAEAQDWCSDDGTRGGSTEDGTAWFDGYDEE